MTYAYNLVLRKGLSSDWTIFSEAGVELHTLHRCGSAEDAMNKAQAWASSWNSVTIRIEDESNKKRD